MQSKKIERRSAARRHRRLRWITSAILATGFSTHCVWADDLSAGNTSIPNNPTAAVLRSVGIKFRPSESPAPELKQPTTVASPSSDVARTGQTTFQNVKPIQPPKADVTLPPLFAGEAPKIQSPSASPSKAVKIEMRPTLPLSNSSPKLTIQQTTTPPAPPALSIQTKPTLPAPSTSTIPTKPSSSDAAPKIVLQNTRSRPRQLQRPRQAKRPLQLQRSHQRP